MRRAGLLTIRRKKTGSEGRPTFDILHKDPKSVNTRVFGQRRSSAQLTGSIYLNCTCISVNPKFTTMSKLTM